MLRLALILGLLLALLAGVFVWSRGASQGRADFTIVNRGDIRTLDPNRMSWLEDIRVGYGLWEGLYALDPKTLAPIPGVAKRTDISPDQRIYTFHLRPDARWSNGDPVTASDFVFAWRRMLDEPSNYSYLFRGIRGVRQYQEDLAARRPPDFAPVGIRAVDPATLRVELDQPIAYFPDLCAFAPFWPMHEPSMKRFYDPAGKSYGTGFTRPPNLVSNGPFRLVSWDFKRRLRLEANPHYWDRSQVQLKSVDVLIADSDMWGFLKYDSGAADWLADASGPIGAELFAKKRRDFHSVVAMGSYYYTLNCKPRLPDGSANPLADPRVRRALSLALDRGPIVQSVTRMGEPPTMLYIPPGVFAGYQSPTILGYDIAKARGLLSAAGYPGGKGFPHLSILYNGESLHADVAQMVRRQWMENLGIDISLEGQEVRVFRQRLHDRDYAIARASWFGDYNAPSTFTDKYRSDSDNNEACWANADYDRLLDQAARETDAARRMDLFRQAETLLLQEQPIIPIYHYVSSSAYRNNVAGIAMNPRNMVMLKAIGVLKGSTGERNHR